MSLNFLNTNTPFSIRKNCIFCNHGLSDTYFTEDLSNFVAHYSVDENYNNNNSHEIPFNVCICDNCNTPQIKYLGDLEEIYKINHADSTGEVMLNLHIENLNFILKYKDKINNVIEIGSSKGVLADLLLEKLNLTYFIIEPSYFGSLNDNKILINDFYENVDDSNIDADTLIMSHVLEHFYEPIKILEKIKNNKNIKNIFLTFPDLEYYVNNNVFHVLNTEHTFYVDNNFLINVFKFFGFELVEKIFYKNHSVLFYFEKTVGDGLGINFDFKNQNYNLSKFYSKIKDTVNNFNEIINNNEDKEIYLWPASIHSLYLLMFGLNQTKLKGLTDNSPNKIGNKMYGTNLKVYDFKKVSNEQNSTILLNGGIFNSEVNGTFKN